MAETLQGTIRDKLGTRSSRVLRAQGRIPASIQGEGKGHVNLSLEAEQFLAARRHQERLFDIELDQGDPETAMVRELQWDAFGEHIIHVEFRRVVRGQETESEVPLVFHGHPKGGILNHLVSTVLVHAIPSKIPDKLEVNVDELGIGDSLLAGEIELPEGVRLGVPEDLHVAVIVTARGVAEVEAAAEEAEALAEGEAAPTEGEAPGGETEE